MLGLVYDSLTGNVRRFAQQVAGEAGAKAPLSARLDAPEGPFLLLTYTFGTGDVPGSTRAFLDRHGPLLRGVVASGSYHWGVNFARAADVIAAEYGVPVVARINKGGTAADRAQVVAWLRARPVGTPSSPSSSLPVARRHPWNPGSN